MYQLERLKAYVSALPKIHTGHSLSEHERLALEALTTLRLVNKEELCKTDPATNRYEELEAFLGKMYKILFSISDVVSKTYCKHAQAQQQLFR